MSYTEKIKQRMIAGNFSKPDELYPELINEIAEKKDAIVTLINSLFNQSDIDSVVDVGGGRGDLLVNLASRIKTVVDKREFIPHYGIEYIIEEYRPEHTADTDLAIYSEFLHLFDEEEIKKIIDECQAKRIVVIENKYDDFLDLRLRLWSNGRCIEPEYITRLMGTAPFIVNDYNVWIKENNNG